MTKRILTIDAISIAASLIGLFGTWLENDINGEVLFASILVVNIILFKEHL